jgi:hypothetical protein
MVSDVMNNLFSPPPPQVFIHDPLYKWALTPLGMQQRQNEEMGDDAGASMEPIAGAAADSGGLANADAERALLKVKQKLEGLEAGGCRRLCQQSACMAAHAGGIEVDPTIGTC